MIPLALVRNDLRLLWRHGFAAAYLVVGILYAALLSALPRDWADAVLPVLAWSDAAFFCFFFAGASVCLDLSQGTFAALCASPLEPAAYVVVKAADLAALSFAMAALVAASSRGAGFSAWLLAASALSGGAPAAVIGAALALRLKTVNRFMAGSIPAFLLLGLPAAAYALPDYLPAWVRSAAALMPTEGSLRLARAAFAPAPALAPAAAAASPTMTPGWLALGALSALLWTAGASVLLLAPAVRAAREA